MDGSATGTVTGHDEHNGRFINGHSQYRARKDRLAERLRQLTLDFDPSPSQQMLLPIIASALDDAERARSAVVRTRAANTARRLLKDIPRKPEPLPATDFERELWENLRNADNTKR